MFGIRNINTKANTRGHYFRSDKPLSDQDVKEARRYIAGYWKKLIRHHSIDDETLLGLPKPYLVPAYEMGHEFDFNELYYWDSYFMVQALLIPKHRELVLGILDDLFSEYKRFGVIPNASRVYLMGHSQPPFLTSFIWDVFEAYKLSPAWLKKALAVAESEYKTVWMGSTKPNARQVYKGLSRYYDINYLNDLAETESGWDYSPRFNRKALQYLPIDLNVLLYKYEMDFARGERLFKNYRAADKWEAEAQHRKELINELMWDNNRGLFYDYNYTKGKRGNISSLASYYAMWAGLASEAQAEKMVRSLRRFEVKGGLSTTDALPFGQFVLGSIPMQWAYPNGWAPLHFLVVKGLKRYGYNKEASRIAMKWLKTNLVWFETNGVFLEKYNVLQPDKPPALGVYPSQTGFGWTNSVFECFCQEFIDKSTSRESTAQ
ncbi:MAG: trehalase family glycosidase [Candidatus Saccharimonadales bacterium]